MTGREDPGDTREAWARHGFWSEAPRGLNVHAQYSSFLSVGQAAKTDVQRGDAQKAEGGRRGGRWETGIWFNAILGKDDGPEAQRGRDACPRSHSGR